MGPVCPGKCPGCGEVNEDISVLQCAQQTCKKTYHLNCIGITQAVFENLTQEFKCNWVCPECKLNIPKGDNSNTPVRGSGVMDKTFTPSTNVNMNRGARYNLNESSMADNDNKVLEELREFRLEMHNRLNEQMKEYTLLQNRFHRSETELQELRKIMEVVQEKANKVDVLESRIVFLIEKNEHLETCLKLGNNIMESKETKRTPTTPPLSFVKVVAKNIAPKDNAQGGATKPASMSKTSDSIELQTIIDANPLSSLDKTSKKENQPEREEENWTTVNRKKTRYLNSQVKKGGNTNYIDIQGMEKKKYLHIWRLKKDTTVENLEKHIKNVILRGHEIQVKVDKIIHKTERDYASFIIGVPESQYDKLCQSENWPINIEFCEWVWFRRSTKTPNNNNK